MSYNIFRSKKGFEKLGYEGYLYNLDKRNANYTLWRCELSKKPGHKCSGRAKLTASTIEVYTAHSHPPDHCKLEADILKSKIYEAAEDPFTDSKSLLREAAHLASTTPGVPKLCSMQRVISRKRRSTQCLIGANKSEAGRPPKSISDPCTSLEVLIAASEHLRLLFTPGSGMEEVNTADNSKIRLTALQTDALLKTSRGDNAVNEEATCSTFSDHPQKESATEHFKKESNEMDVNSYLSEVSREAHINDLMCYDLAVELDKRDPLRHLRDEFYYPKMKTIPRVDYSLVNEDDDCIYMCGNSLGLMLKSTRKYMDIQFEKWANMGVCGHTEEPLPWAHCDEAVVEGIAKLVGAEPSEVALMNGLTVNLHIFLAAFYKPTKNRHKILLESKAFPSDHYAIESQIRLKGFTVEDSMVCVEPRKDEDCLRNEDILSVIEREGDSIAIIMFSGLQYYTGQLFDIEAITKAGHKKGCIVGWNLAHAFANVPLSLHEWNVDFACWCTYKYGSSSAGGLAGAFIHSKYNSDKRERMLGWWAHKASTRFIMDNKLELDDGAAGYRISNPPMMLVVPLQAFLEVMSKTSLEELRRKSILLTGYLEFLINHHLSPNSSTGKSKKVQCSIMTPSDPRQRGCQLSLKFNVDIVKVFEELTKRGVVVDKRYPNVIRVTPVHLYNSFRDVHRFVEALLDSLDEIEHSV